MEPTTAPALVMRAGVIFCGGALHVATGVRTSGCLLLIPSSCLGNADADSGMTRYEARDNARRSLWNPATSGALRRLVIKKGATVSRTGGLHVLLVLTLGACLVSSSAEARKWWRWRHFYRVYDYGYVARSGDDGRRDRVSEMVETARARTGGGSFGAVIDRLIRGCVQQAAELQNLPFDEITRIVAPDDTQRAALEALRASATAEAQRVSAQCPQDEPAPPGARLEAVEQAIDTATATFAAVDPPLRAFYAALDDEQKARLLRDLTLSKSQAREGDRAARRGAI